MDRMQVRPCLPADREACKRLYVYKKIGYREIERLVFLAKSTEGSG